MSKRKNRSKSPNLPEETLARARQQAGLEPPPQSEETPSAPPAVPAPAVVPLRESSRRANRRMAEGGGEVRSRRTSANKPMTMEEVAYALSHPTKVVSEDDLRRDYAYVLNDLRSMGLLAAALAVVLVLLFQIL